MKIALMVTKMGILPLSFLKTLPYKGKLIRTKTPHSTICNANLSMSISLSFFIPIITFLTIAKKVNKFNNAMDSKMTNMDESTPNSMISFSYLFDTFLSVILDVITNFMLENPKSFRIVSMIAKR